ncbi:MAG: AAA family ATPase [Malacoplasma sp.]
MIFLKKFEAKGFKSYAENVKLNFDDSLIGIVGPNGAGKSNVIDAIKWVLGEKSNKALRGNKSDDVIFHGSQSKDKSEFAEVTLTFDNAKKILYSKEPTVAVTRRLYRGSGNSEYFINGELTRLKDVMDIFTDTGLSKGSLGIISQNTVNWFADAKPEDRRTIFEEAAGIGRYTRKKDESLRQLERTQSNLNRLIDILKELQRDLKKLETQAAKVKEYSEKKEELTLLEISILAKDVTVARDELVKIQNILNNSKEEKDSLIPQILQSDGELSKCKGVLEQSDNRIQKFNWELNEIIAKINKLEIEKSIFDIDIKSDSESKDFATKVEALFLTIKTLESEHESKKTFYDSNKKELIAYEEQLINLENHRDLINHDKIELIKKNVENFTTLHHINDLIVNKPNQEYGSKSIIENKGALTGILGTILDFIKTDSQYEKPLLLALGRNVNNIVVNTSRDAKRGIDFLVENKAGTCTFMPVYEMKPKPIKQEHLEILFNLEGFIDIASNLIKADKKIRPIIDTLLGKVIICRDFDSAIEISKYTFQLYKIITLDGQVINPQGSITGGYSKLHDNLFLNLETKKKSIEKEINDNKTKLAKLEIQSNDTDLDITNIRNRINERKINDARYTEIISQLEKDIVSLKSEYQKYSKTSYDSPDKSKNINPKDNYSLIVGKLNSLKLVKEKIETDLNQNEQTKKQIKNRIIQLEDSIANMRGSLDSHKDLILNYEIQLVNHNNTINNIKDKLNETYKITIEHAIEKYNTPLQVSDSVARQKIDRLNKELNYMGNINMDAIKELEDKKGRYEKMQKEHNEISEARDKIFEVIKELDTKAHIDFQTTIDKINHELPETFKYLFGGGTCKVSFTDPADILLSGIDIIVSPPGKHVNSLFALSGGEKTLVALSILFAILKVSSLPLVILDEAESALDPSNVERFGDIISRYSNDTQFIVITHRPGTMERCEKLYGATMKDQGITTMYSVKVKDAQHDFGYEDTSDK